MDKNVKVTYTGLGVPGLLGVAFVILKLCGVIHWSWLWVIAPFWIPIGIGIILVLIDGMLLAFANKDKNE